MNKQELGQELLENMDLTKEQYIATCELIEQLELEKVASGIVEDTQPIKQ